ncbi:MAG: ATP-binding cassette domain-containing protein [Saezia sp.]
METKAITQGDIAISIKDVTHRFPKTAQNALDDISFSMQYGVITGLAGPDGAGKTTLMRLMAGLLKATRGSIQVAGFDPIGQVDELRAHIGYMPQKFGLYEDLSVMENLKLYADLRGVTGAERQAQFEKLLSFTNLHAFTQRMAGKLSGGMKQKLGLACTLLGTPKVLLLDEPGVGVDPISRRELWTMVSDLAGQGLAIVWATAYLDEAQQCGELCLMNAGKIIFSGTPEQAMQTMQGRSIHIKNIDGSRRHLLQRALVLPEVVDGVIQGSSVRLVMREAGQRPSLEKIEAGASAFIEEVEPRLEDMFIDALGGGPHKPSVLAEHMTETVLPEGVDANAVILVDSLTRRFGTFVATDHVTFNVRQGEIFGLIGPNGAGKSTTFKMLCGLLKISEGKALVMGMDLRKSAPQIRQNLGYMAQKFSLYGDLSVRQNLEFFSGIYGLRGEKREQRIAEMVSCFDLQPYWNTATAILPLGFKQRLALACALIHEPQLLFLDEPTSGVDPVTRREFWGHINGLVDKGVTVLVTTHFMDEAEYCDRIALIYRGKAIAVGSVDELKQQVKTDQRPDPSMEDAFVELILRSEEQYKKQQATQKPKESS